MLWYIYTPEFERIGAIEHTKSMQWKRCWNAAGRFDLLLPMSDGILTILKKENLIVRGKEACIIEYVHPHQEDGEDVIECGGRTLLAYADRRVALGTAMLSGPAENVMTQLVFNNAIKEGTRKIPHLTAATSRGRGKTVEYQAANKMLLNELEYLSEESRLGIGIYFTGAGMEFSVSAGLDRSAGQSANPRAIFAPSFENILSCEYEVDTSDLRNTAIVGYEKDDITLTEIVGGASGRERRELYIDASSIEKDDEGNALTETQMREMMRIQGNAALVTHVEAESFTAAIDPEGNLKYKTHYDLGDIVTVRHDGWGLQQDVQITEITEIYEESGARLEVTFGTRGELNKFMRRMLG